MKPWGFGFTKLRQCAGNKKLERIHTLKGVILLRPGSLILERKGEVCERGAGEAGDEWGGDDLGGAGAEGAGLTSGKTGLACTWARRPGLRARRPRYPDTRLPACGRFAIAGRRIQRVSPSLNCSADFQSFHAANQT
jgi:hypothetical protein